MFYSNTGSKHKNMLDRFVHQINTLVLVNISLEKFCCRKETWGYTKEKKRKIAQKKEKKEKKRVEKMDTKMSGVLKTMGTKMPAMKKREIAPALANILSFNKRDMSQGAK
jgi:hypothetical protein